MSRAALRTVAIVLALVAAYPAFAQNRVALVIGNAGYRHVPALVNPTNDAADTAASLGRLGFAVTRIENADYDGMRRALLDFSHRARGAEVAAVFFAGHGMEAGGENWLIPVDAGLRTDTDFEHEAIGLKAVMLAVSGASRLGLVMLDSCRNNPFAAQMQRTARTRAVERGLARVEPTGSVLVAYAARDGTTAADGSGRNSPFTSALLRHIETPGLEINFLFRNVRDDVLAATRSQEPYVYGSLSRDPIYLKAPASPGSAVATAPSNPPVTSSPDTRPVAPATGDTSWKTAALGTQPVLLGQFGDWGAYAVLTNGKVVCYAIARPNRQDRRRDGTYVMVSNRPADKVANEISITFGYAVNGRSAVVMELPSTTVAMWTNHEGAWIKNPAEEARTIAAMRSVSTLTVRGTSSDGAKAFDHYSLQGLPSALERASERCRL
jgi:hypothetical protein